MAESLYPFTAFNFRVEINRGTDGFSLVSAAFSECDGLEMSMEIKTIREGGANDRQIHLNGPVSYSQLTLKRGMTSNFELWEWFQESMHDPRLRADADVVLLASDGIKERVKFTLSRCVPVKMKAPAMNAKEGQIAVEELQIAYETLQFAPPKS